MEAIIKQIKQLAGEADETTHRELMDTFRQLLYTIERPEDTHFQLAVARLAQNTSLIKVLVKNKRLPMTVKQVATETGISQLLTERVLRYMSAMGMVSEISERNYAANKNTEALDTTGVRAGIGFGMDIVSPSAQALPDFLAQHGFQNPESIENCPFHPGHNKEMNVMQYLFSNPFVLGDFNTVMQHQRLNTNIWLDVYSLNVSSPVTSTLFVDIGGGVGHMCLALKQRFPALQARVILQDLAGTINNLPDDQPFERMVHDYFTEQPVKEAKYYYFRNIMHNLTDESCEKVLAQTKAAMGFDSKILVDDIVVPAKGAHWRTVQLDFLMLSALGAMERTEEQWETLFGKVGLKIANKYVYDRVQGDAVLEVVAV